MSNSTIRLGTASPGTQATTAATIEQVSQIAQRAASQGIDILLLPEAYIGGYPRGTSFGCIIGERKQEGREEYARYFDSAVDLGDTVGENGAGGGDRWVKRQIGGGAPRGDGSREKLEKIAKDSGVFIVLGCIEKAGGTLYCAAVYICPEEGMIGKRRKVMPTGSERLCWGQGSPSTLKAVSTTIRGVRINLAAAICWENYMPLLRQTLYAQNINLYLAPTADNRDAWLSLMRTVGIEGRCFVVSSNMCVPKAAAPAAGAGSSSAGTRSRRRNSTITAEGNEIALPGPSAAQAKSRSRRKSVFDEDGNEIVLCQGQQPKVNGEAVGDQVASSGPPPAQAKSRSRRKSVFDEDGNEIVLCRGQEPKVHGEAVGEPVAATGPPAGFESRGGSSIVSPMGDVLAGPQWEDNEGLIYSDVDFRDCIKGRLDFDAAGSYSRNDSFNFSVNGLDLDPLSY